MHGFGEQHHSQPKMISLTQCTELGTVYTPAELKEIAKAAGCEYESSFILPTGDRVTD